MESILALLYSRAGGRRGGTLRVVDVDSTSTVEVEVELELELELEEEVTLTLTLTLTLEILSDREIVTDVPS